MDTIYQTLDGLKDIKPDFISVTFGAGGSQVNQSTREIATCGGTGTRTIPPKTEFLHADELDPPAGGDPP